MTFRTRLLLIFTISVVAAVGTVDWIVAHTTRRSFERLEDQRITALAAQFRREFDRRRSEIARRVDGIANADSTVAMAIALNRPEADYSPYVGEAQSVATAQGLDLLELIAPDGTIVSSAQWPARFGYKEEWVAQPRNWHAEGAFLTAAKLPDGSTLALEAVGVSRAADAKLYVVGGQQIDREFLGSLVLPSGMRALLYLNLEPEFSPHLLTDVSGPVRDAGKLAPLIGRMRRDRREVSGTVQWTGEPTSAETFFALPLTGRDGSLLGAFLVGSSRRALVQLERFLLWTGLLVAAGGILLGIVLAWWATARVTRPVKALVKGAGAVAAGNWEATVEIASADEIGQLAQAFNQMTRQLIEQRDRLIQSERVAAWRELARRLAHELKNPLFPLQITVENMQRAHDRHPEQFDEVFRESSATILAELDNLKRIVARFSDFAKMPPPELQTVDVNDLARSSLRLFEAQLSNAHVAARLELDEKVKPVEADPEQLGRALHNLVLNAIDAMPQGGTLTIRTAQRNGAVRIDVSDTGTGLTPEECARLFTPYYTTKTHGTGLGLAIVQSVVSDHRGRIAVESEPGKGATFRIELQN